MGSSTGSNDEICENPWKSSKILDEYPTKIDEKSRFEHVQVTLCKKAWFSRPERFWSRSGNALDQAPKFHGFSSENCSDPYRIQKMNVFRSDLPPGSVQNDARKRWNMWKSVKIVENPRWVPYKNRREMHFWPRPGNTLEKSVIFTSGTILVTFR